MKTHRIENVECVRETAKAICVESEDFEESVWIPKSVVHDDSEVYKDGDIGSLVVELWFAEKQNLI